MQSPIVPDKLNRIFRKSRNKKIAVIGDVMLDKYVYGDVSRISPEAPVQVVDIQKTEYKLGGAANVANNIKTLESEPVLIGIIGKDLDGDYFTETMKKQKLFSGGIIRDSSRQTTAKTRIIAHSQHILRIDSEVKRSINGKAEKDLLGFFSENINNFESVILQDYNKGVLSVKTIRQIIKLSREKHLDVYVDPKFDNFFEYKNVTVFKPNRKEIQDVLGRRIDRDDSAIQSGKELIDSLKCEYLVLTRGEKGMMLFDKEKNKTVVLNIPTRARRVADVSGAGDTVISTIAVALSGGASIIESVFLANLAAGIVCEEVGIVPVFKKNLIDAVKDESN
jgi:rfaE bifunctional protein kinase chain/domain